MEEFARVVGQDFLNFALPEINVIFRDNQEDISDNDLESVADNEFIPTETWDTLGQPSGKFDFLVKYTAPASSRVRFEDIQPTGWEDLSEYDMSTEDAYFPSQASRSTEREEMKGLGSTKEKIAKSGSPMVNTITKDNPKQDMPDFIMHNGVRHYWTAVEVPTVVHISK